MRLSLSYWQRTDIDLVHKLLPLFNVMLCWTFYWERSSCFRKWHWWQTNKSEFIWSEIWKYFMNLLIMYKMLRWPQRIVKYNETYHICSISNTSRRKNTHKNEILKQNPKNTWWWSTLRPDLTAETWRRRPPIS